MHEYQQVEILSQWVKVKESQSIEKKLSKNQDSRNLILLKLELPTCFGVKINFKCPRDSPRLLQIEYNWEKRLLLIMMILCSDNSSMSYSLATKCFLCAAVIFFFWKKNTISPIELLVSNILIYNFFSHKSCDKRYNL